MTQIISALGLWFYPTVAMVIFLVVFVLTMAWHLHPGRRPVHIRAASLPLEEDTGEPTARDLRTRCDLQKTP